MKLIFGPLNTAVPPIWALTSVIFMYNVHMISLGNLKFDWDKAKNKSNKRKHGVSFEEAVTVFLSIPLLIFHDPDHSEDEDRFLAVGVSINNRTLVVVH